MSHKIPQILGDSCAHKLPQEETLVGFYVIANHPEDPSIPVEKLFFDGYSAQQFAKFDNDGNRRANPGKICELRAGKAIHVQL